MNNLNKKIDEFLNEEPKVGEEVCDLKTGICYVKTADGLIERKLIEKKLVISCHDVSSGGLLTCLSQMCIAGNLGAKINSPKSLINLNEYFLFIFNFKC